MSELLYNKKEVLYKKINDTELYFNILEPLHRVYEKAPFVVHIHGGGFTQGDKDRMGAMFGVYEELLELGFAILSIDYRLQPKPRTVDDLLYQYEDCMDAIKIITRYADEYKLDIDKMGVYGNSAGGTLALICGLCDPNEFPGDSDLRNVSFTVKYIVNLFGIPDFQYFEHLKKTENRGAGVWWRNELSKEEKERLAVRYSAIHYLKQTSPPIFTVHGTIDPVVPYELGKALYKKSLAIGHEARFITIENGGHGLNNLTVENANPRPEIWMRQIKDFIYKKSGIDIKYKQ